jgi:hypothetical protein
MLIAFSLSLDLAKAFELYMWFQVYRNTRTVLIEILIQLLTIFSFCRCVSASLACSHSDLPKISNAWVETLMGG